MAEPRGFPSSALFTNCVCGFRMQGMEQWLAATDLSHHPPSYESTQESMTTAEFDKFLEERATKVSAEPNVPSSQSRRARPQMQQEGTQQEEELFGL
jgi:hypothetical protein